MKKAKYIELLSPAKNLECGIEAIKHGADAVYIGAPRFGARAGATNSIDDIRQLVEFAHIYRVKIYVTVNTILRDDELKDTEEMIWELYKIGVDALIVQDFALLSLNLPPIPLHASTQMDNRTPEQAKFLADLGFEQVVLARELSIGEISEIHKATDVPLEVFVHGALCVSYSGQCYVSQHCYNRSANRGECAQFCRLAFDMIDADGKTIHKAKHLLSLKDMNQSENLEALMDAGARSFKIEGRLKDASYVKNVTAYYRQKIDEILKRREEYKRASSGTSELQFKPVVAKSFNRGFTTYFANGRQSDIASIYTPKSLGEMVGTVKEIGRGGRYFSVAGIASFSNGDGLCFIDENGSLQGFRVNRVEGNRLYPKSPVQGLKQRVKLYRNSDQEFEKLLSKDTAERRLAVDMKLYETSGGFALTATDEDNQSVTLAFDREKEQARSPQENQIRTQLAKLGNTPFALKNLEIEFSDNWFVPSSVLAEWRR
ncbi:MAG: U32 family peptidase, partial [Bacteroidaceae bacterium]|nr:U32 family peptidase [Bacteroidaceae bacterium]